jgi:hypothetical protein
LIATDIQMPELPQIEFEQIENEDWIDNYPNLYQPEHCLINEHMIGTHLYYCCLALGPLIGLMLWL